MAGMFVGEYTFKVDGKGRMSIPADYRRELEACDLQRPNENRPRIAIVATPNKSHLECHSYDDFRRMAADIANMDRGSMQRRILERMVLGATTFVEVEPDGRLVLPQKLREKIGLSSEALFLGQGETFTIWNPETFAAEDQAQIDGWLEEMPADFDVYSLLGAAKTPPAGG